MSHRRTRSADIAAIVLTLVVAGVLIAGLASIHPGPIDAIHDTLQDWVLDFFER